MAGNSIKYIQILQKQLKPLLKKSLKTNIIILNNFLESHITPRIEVTNALSQWQETGRHGEIQIAAAQITLSTVGSF